MIQFMKICFWIHFVRLQQIYHLNNNAHCFRNCFLFCRHRFSGFCSDFIRKCIQTRSNQMMFPVNVLCYVVLCCVLFRTWRFLCYTMQQFTIACCAVCKMSQFLWANEWKFPFMKLTQLRCSRRNRHRPTECCFFISGTDASWMREMMHQFSI